MKDRSLPAAAARRLLAALLFAAAVAGVHALDATLRTPDRLFQGDPLVCVLEAAAPLRGAAAALADARGAAAGFSRGFYLPGSGEGSTYVFMFALPRAMAPGLATVSVRIEPADAASPAGTIELKARVLVEQASFAREDIPLDAANTELRTLPDPAKTAESVEFARIFQLPDPTALFATGTMTRPLASSWRITSGYSDERRYVYASGGSETSFHGGLDLGAARGTPVLACAAGRVVFSAPRIVTGNTIVIEHLPGLFSIYMHLDARAARQGDVVARGEPIGTVGSTGLSTGPHLHWELRIGPDPVNPQYWLTSSLLDKAP